MGSTSPPANEADAMSPALRAEIARRIDAVLEGRVDLRALARAGGAFNAAGIVWHGHRVVPAAIARRLARIATTVTARTAADLVLWSDRRSKVYMRRWWLERQETDGRGQHGYYIHRFENDDPARMHNHPWPCASLMLVGSVVENAATGTTRIEAGDVLFRPATHRHRVTLPCDAEGNPMPAITLMATGRRVQEWELEHADGTVSVNGEGRAADDR